MVKFCWSLFKRACAVLLVSLGAAGLLSCGGGTSQIEPFVPQQVIVLGDENNLLTVDGKRYGINGLDAASLPDCRLLQVWTQSLAGSFGLVTDRCTTGATVAPRGVTRAAFGAKAADIDAQITAQIGVAALTSKDLFTIMVGMHDILELYQQYPTRSEESISDELRLRGHHVADQINRLIEADARVIVSTVHDLGTTPYALAERARTADTDRAALLSRLTAVYNARVRVDIVQDGRFVGLVLADDLSQLMVRAPSNYSLTNVTQAACTSALPDCTTQTLVTGATNTSHLWADELHLGPVAHSQLSTLAQTRARNNPF
jgi:outer membrane lipase/esterase